MIKKTDNYRRYPGDDEEDLLATSGIFRIIYRFLSHKTTLRLAIEEATALYQRRRNAAVDARIKYLFFSAILAIIRLVDRLEASGKKFYQETIRQKIIDNVKKGFLAFWRMVAAVPGVLADTVREFFSSVKGTRSEQKHKKAEKRKELDDLKSSKIEGFVLWLREVHRSFTSKRTVYFIISIVIHAAIFYFLKFHKPRHIKPPDSFDMMHAIQLVDATPRAKDKASTKGDEKQGEEKREKSSEDKGKPEIKEAPKADIRTARKETLQPLEQPDAEITPQDIAQQEPALQEKSITEAKTQSVERQLTQAKNIDPQKRARAAVPTAMKERKQYRSGSMMRRRPISPSVSKRVSSQQQELAMVSSISSLSRTRPTTMTPQVEAKSFSSTSLQAQAPEAERKTTAVPTPSAANFEKFVVEKTVDMKKERAGIARTRMNFTGKRTLKSSRMAFSKTKISGIPTPEGDEHDMDSGSPRDTPGKTGDILSGVERKESLMTGMAITLRTPLMRGGFTVGDVPQETLKKESMVMRGPLRRSQMASLRGIKYHGRTAKGGPVSFQEERVTYNAKSRVVLKRVEVSSDELGNVEELDDFSPEDRPSPVTQLKNLSKRTSTPVENFSSSTSSQYFQGLETDTEKEIQGEKLIALAQRNPRDGDNKTPDHKKLVYKTSKNIKPVIKKEVEKKTTADSQLTPEKKITSTGKIKIKADLPMGNITQDALYTLRGEIDSDIKQAFVTINDTTQMVTVKDGVFVAKLAMVEGINSVNVLAFSSRGEIGNKAFKVLFRPRKAVPMINILSPENGKQGLKEGDMILVAGKISDKTIKSATLILNNSRIKIKVRKGRFRHKIFLPASRVNTFRISATAKNGMTGYSPLHTILIGANFDINNPRPY